MKQYILIIVTTGAVRYLNALNDEDAELWVAQNYDEGDGPLSLYKLQPVMSWD